MSPRQHKPHSPVFVAIDTTDIAAAKQLIDSIAPITGAIKLGLEFFTAHGPQVAAELTPPKTALFLDIKLHDIPNTVAGAITAACKLAPYCITIHTSGGEAMLKTARDAADAAAVKLKVPRPKLMGVTVLTSLLDDDLKVIGQITPVDNQVRRLALLAQDCGLDGVICSPHELRDLRTLCGPDFMLISPGIRLAGANNDDQRRVMSPGEALAAGADYLVIGRPITGAQDPAQAAADILASLN